MYVTPEIDEITANLDVVIKTLKEVRQLLIELNEEMTENFNETEQLHERAEDLMDELREDGLISNTQSQQ